MIGEGGGIPFSSFGSRGGKQMIAWVFLSTTDPILDELSGMVPWL